MKLSEAIRLGAMLKPQGTGSTFGDKTCALGAALEAVGCTDKNSGWFPVYDIFPIARVSVQRPIDGERMLLGTACWSTNDKYGWTREQIADWVETIEAQHENPVASCVAVEVRTQQETVTASVAHSAPK